MMITKIWLQIFFWQNLKRHLLDIDDRNKSKLLSFSLKFSLTLNTVFKKPEFSVYFVAFDGEESGCRGSQEFIYSHLKPHLDATGGQAQGAFILDTILNYDKRPGS